MHSQMFEWAVTHGIARAAFAIGEERDEKFCVVPTSTGWLVFYSERGHKREAQEYLTLDQALNELQSRLLREPTTRVAFRSSHGWAVD